MPAAEVLIGLHVDALFDEAYRAIPEAEIGSAGVIGLEAPRDVPVPDTIGGIDAMLGAVGVAVGPTGVAIDVRIDRPIDRLNGLSLGHGVVTRPAPVIAPALELVLTH